jgi:hypothetical protein
MVRLVHLGDFGFDLRKKSEIINQIKKGNAITAPPAMTSRGSKLGPPSPAELYGPPLMTSQYGINATTSAVKTHINGRSLLGDIIMHAIAHPIAATNEATATPDPIFPIILG